MKHTKLSVALASAVILAFGTQFAGAVATMRISDGTTTLTITDEGNLDAFPGLGVVTFVGTVGNFSINVNTGVTMPAGGTAVRPYMDVNFIAASTGAGGTLAIEFSEIGFGPMATGDNFHISIGGTTGGTINCTTLVDVNNALFGGVPMASQTFGPSGAYACEASAPGIVTSPFSLTKRLTITHGSGFLSTSGDTELKVPDGGATLALFGISLVGLGALRKKLRKS